MSRFAACTLTAFGTMILAVSLAGCAIAPPVQGDNAAGRPRASTSAIPETDTSAAPSITPSTPTTPTGPNAIDCGDTPDVRLNEPGIEYTVVGACDSVTVEGQDIEVDAANIGDLIIRGDRNSVDADNVTTAAISGTENEIEASSIETVDISGERNDIDARGTIGLLTISGNDNDVDAGAITDQSIAGDRNEITVR